jgi:hypothetical protein
MSTRGGRSCACSVLALVALLTTAGAVADSGPQPLPRPIAAVMERARAGAARRLQADECQKVFTDFTDAEGHRLMENLEGRGLNAAEYLQTISFVDGSSTRSCRLGAWVLLVARPGSGSVDVCPVDGRPFTSRLTQLQLRNPAMAESIVIHEMLHTLGLGENPPTSEEITRQVQRRCGS